MTAPDVQPLAEQGDSTGQESADQVPVDAADALPPSSWEPLVSTSGDAPVHPTVSDQSPEQLAQSVSSGAGAPAPVQDLDVTAEPTPIKQQLAVLQTAIERLEARVVADSERAVARERVIDRQHEEVERLRGERRANQLRPVVTDLYRLRNDLLRQVAAVREEIPSEDVVKLLSSYAGSVEEALERCGVSVMPHEIGMSFVAGRHQVAGVIETDEAELGGTVAEIVQDGYAETDGTVVAPARIRLYRYATKETTHE